SFAVNIILASILVGPFRGAGIAFSLSFTSLINTVLLLVFLGRNANIKISIVVRPALFYILRMIVLSAIAVIPVWFLSPWLKDLFAGNARIISYGIPFVINGFIFILLGFTMLVIVKDQHFLGIIGMIKKRLSSKG
ncbi:MAG: murein biosynthesis integral membrane protein MurJ, partial [Treponema sp.]|nr:murein biosynthesis integral membrane protein MurJ [Treponema sp.]